MQKRYYEDWAVGDKVRSEGRTITQGEMVEFAWSYDPQPFHIDEIAAKDTPFGGLIASGMQTLGITFRLGLQASGLIGPNFGGRGVDELRWYQPVRPGDTLYARMEVIEKRDPKPGKNYGDIRFQYETLNQHGDVVMSHIGNHIVKCREDAA